MSDIHGVSSVEWDMRFLELAHHVSGWSKDPSTKVGCVVRGENRKVLLASYNGFPRGVADTPNRLIDRSIKYPMIVHAEENAVAQAAYHGIRLQGAWLYCTWQPCARCARLLIQTGIERVYYTIHRVPQRWAADFELAQTMLKEAGLLSVGIALSEDRQSQGRERK